MKYVIAVENIKCGGCANSIHKHLQHLPVVDDVDVDVERGTVTVDGAVEQRQLVTDALAKMGYPEVGSVEGIRAAKAAAKSFVSCAVGRMTKAGD